MNLKGLALSLTLTCVLSGAAIAGETLTAPSREMPSPTCAPGEVLTPPCTAQVVNKDSATAGEVHSQPASVSTDVIELAQVVVWSLILF